ncbi:ABC transporter substrate-binding protein [uncultured Sphaerochaeta sp.]|uniref:ABC transporter substrate-binding protein n=1 Tax=uncultured Sphaerochaeta sp. TaxID=886478 RepID=UPI002A0A92DC|nr:ABC transporter substrate-binding protein [uncultured Sphaerochaeta sp.]
MKKILALLIVITLFVPTVFAAGQAEEVDTSVIKLGVLAPLTGTNAEYGKGFEVGMQMAVDKINAEGGVNGYSLELVVRDSKGDQKESSDLARQFADDSSIYAILGDFTSGCCMANAPIVDAAGLVQLSPTASNPDYAGMSDYAFSIMGRQDGEAPFFAKYIIQKYLGLNKVGVIYINSDWGASSYSNFKAEADRIGLDIVSSVNYVQDEKDFSSLITRLRAADPEVVLILDQGAVPQIINQIRGAGWGVQLATLGPGTSEQLIDLAGKNAEGLVLSTPFFFDEDDADLMAWRNEFVERAGFEPTIHPVCAYDTVYLIEAAISAIGDGKVTRQAIRDNLAKVSINGVSGPLQFNPTGDLTREYMICAVENGKYVVKAGFDYAKNN